MALIEDGDTIEISIPERRINLAVSDEEMASRRAAQEAKGDAAWKPTEKRERKVSAALKVFAAFATSASEGAARKID